MAHGRPCPKEWEYKNHANAGEIGPRCRQLLVSLRQGTTAVSDLAADCRPTHGALFKGLTPEGFRYFAGHYRGEDLRCLKYYEVKIPGDPTVGAPAADVGAHIGRLRKFIVDGVAALDAGHAVPNSQFAVEQKIVATVTLACRVFSDYLRVHPYANGNGHLARFIVWAILGRYGVWPKKWPLNARPPEPDYSAAIYAYRRGDPTLLETFVMRCVLGT